MDQLKLIRYKQLQSTNTTAYQLGERGSPEWTVIVADAQTRGRGRGGKKWYSPKGGLWFSILLRPDIPTNRVSLLQFLTANATRQALADESEISIKLKWPNDLVTKSGKIGGILIESKSQGDRMKFTVVGIGLNINQRKTQLPLGATSLLLETGLQHNRRNLLRKILEQLRSSYDDIDDPSTVMGKWWQYCIHRPPRVQVTLQGGVVSGITRGVDEDGSLTVETDDRRVQKVSDGTLRVLDGFSR